MLIDASTSCSWSLFAPRIPLHRPIGMLPDLCTIIECAMYTDDQSGNDNPNVFGSWPPYSTLFYEFCQFYFFSLSLLSLLSSLFRVRDLVVLEHVLQGVLRALPFTKGRKYCKPSTPRIVKVRCLTMAPAGYGGKQGIILPVAEWEEL